MMRNRVRAVLSVAALLLCASAFAAPPGILFDFEEQVRSAGVSVGDYNSLTSIRGGLTLSLSRRNEDPFDVWDISSPNWDGGPAGWGHRTLSPYYSNGLNGFVANFSQAIRSASIEFGEYDWDPDGLYLRAYSGLNGTGRMLDETLCFLDKEDNIVHGDYWTMSLDHMQGARSLVFGGGGPSTYSYDPVYWDNLRVNVVPEPAFYQMGGLLLFGGLGALRLRKRA